MHIKLENASHHVKEKGKATDLLNETKLYSASPEE
jgi:hypothetical protein